MNFIRNLIHKADRSSMYVVLLSCTGIGIFLYMNKWSYLHLSSDEWVMVYTMLGAALILDYFTFQIPPKGNQQSMDSSVYLASIFMFGGAFSLSVLLPVSLILLIKDRKLTWWKHIVNFSIYSLMIAGAAYVFTWTGGIPGALDGYNLLPYFAALAAYFIINTITLGLFFHFSTKDALQQMKRVFVTESLLVYLCTLILALVLTILVVHNGVLGLLLYLSLSILLSHAFKQLFVMYQSIEEKANTDQRTGLFNHSHFESMLETELGNARSQGTPLSLGLIDIDDFKKYNDRFGHLQGDSLLALLGDFLSRKTEGTSVTAFRYGGEEFTLLMPGMDLDEAYAFMNKLRKQLNDTPFEGVEVFPHGCLSFSAGVARYEVDMYNKSQLVDQADKALYYAKKQGKNNVHRHGSNDGMEQEIDLVQDVRDIEQQLNLFRYKDMDTFKHSKRVYKYALDISELLELDNVEKRNFVLGALIHDIGKLEIPWSILNKKEKLTAEEWETIKGHVTWGKKMAMTNERFADLIPYIELHHERYDGAGYPYGLKGCEIPRLCRMLTVIDSFDAMTTERPYQETKNVDEAIKELQMCSGSQFDPELAELFIRYIQKRTVQQQLV
ncbi:MULTISPECIES: diguanylate cyclase [Paenibacillus]|uniref:bifunctional diguanylate cyclase/phosphohydrolase n=1 Tax=Paenibacillus TaxID=44249 RepID=UPI0007BEAA01|nr:MULTISPECIES: diguanylate cyclase [Paenibacillus]MCZ1263758.1 diguanylate cyclase [Paenibacillus tundrae]WDQ34053.1 diguanylate cyclase [Paenibacillus marchantiae]SEB25427.1 diguanylate cyclase (GGDEF) domain-containing protein [Paenibacillus sp. 276b]SLK08493.1 diguanylate cyclase (GGDEF) domain-containing protein [Paenibacillus sp. RU5A]SOC71066.1 diguanylate cyclase (GGDEF) domain-containing protein [Paenibacillus sp. RU26A]